MQTRSIPARAYKCTSALTVQEKLRGHRSEARAQKDQAELHHLLGNIEEKSGNPLEAVRQYQRAAELDPSEPYFLIGDRSCCCIARWSLPLKCSARAIALFPHSARMLVGLGVAWYSNGSYDQAAQRLCEASDLNPDDPKAYLFLGKIQSVETTQSECSTERLGAVREASA